jgi:serine/threonine protein phosphatase 1
MSFVREFDENTSGRDFVVGDIHGEYTQLMKALDNVCFDSGNDRLLATGDLIDRGEDSLKCLSLTREPWFFSIWGNHEDLMAKALLAGPGTFDFNLWLGNGGEWGKRYDLDTLRSILEEAKAQMPLALDITLGGYRIGIVHADLPTDDWNCMQDPVWLQAKREELLWSRRNILMAARHLNRQAPLFVRNLYALFLGHTPVRDPIRLANRCYIDTGAVLPEGKLTLLDLSSFKLEDIKSSPPSFF